MSPLNYLLELSGFIEVIRIVLESFQIIMESRGGEVVFSIMVETKGEETHTWQKYTVAHHNLWKKS